MKRIAVISLTLAFCLGIGYAEAQKAMPTGADVNVKNKNGKTALMLAKQERHTEVVRLLKQAGARR